MITKAEYGARVRIVRNDVYPTPEWAIGKTGRIKDVDQGVVRVKLDGGEFYGALPAELEEVTS